MDGWKSPGGVKYRAAYAANKPIEGFPDFSQISFNVNAWLLRDANIHLVFVDIINRDLDCEGCF